MTGRRKAAMLTAGVTLAAMISAPAADARQTCRDTGNATVCQTNGSVSIVATPGTTAPPANQPSLPWYMWD